MTGTYWHDVAEKDPLAAQVAAFLIEAAGTISGFNAWPATSVNAGIDIARYVFDVAQSECEAADEFMSGHDLDINAVLIGLLRRRPSAQPPASPAPAEPAGPPAD